MCRALTVPCLMGRRHQCNSTHASPAIVQLRRGQRRKLAWTVAEEAVLEGLREDARVRRMFGQLLPEIASGVLAPRSAAEQLAACFFTER